MCLTTRYFDQDERKAVQHAYTIILHNARHLTPNSFVPTSTPCSFRKQDESRLGCAERAAQLKMKSTPFSRDTGDSL